MVPAAPLFAAAVFATDAGEAAPLFETVDNVLSIVVRGCLSADF